MYSDETQQIINKMSNWQHHQFHKATLVNKGRLTDEDIVKFAELKRVSK